MQPETDAPDRDRFAVVVHVMLQRDCGAGPELFLLRRAGTGLMDGRYALPGGHQLAGESVADAARRECFEETGATPGALVPVCVLPYLSGAHQGVNFVFAADHLTGEPVRADPDHSDDAGWFLLGALPTPTVFWLDEVLDLQRRGEWFRELHVSSVGALSATWPRRSR